MEAYIMNELVNFLPSNNNTYYDFFSEGVPFGVDNLSKSERLGFLRNLVEEFRHSSVEDLEHLIRHGYIGQELERLLELYKMELLQMDLEEAYS